jgi:hypothetical protein
MFILAFEVSLADEFVEPGRDHLPLEACKEIDEGAAIDGGREEHFIITLAQWLHMHVPPLVKGPVAFLTPLFHPFFHYPFYILVDFVYEFKCALIECPEGVLV